MQRNPPPKCRLGMRRADAVARDRAVVSAKFAQPGPDEARRLLALKLPKLRFQGGDGYPEFK